MKRVYNYYRHFIFMSNSNNQSETSPRQMAPESECISSKFQIIQKEDYQWTDADELSQLTADFNASDLVNDDDPVSATSPSRAYLQVGDSVTVEHLEKILPGKKAKPTSEANTNNAFLPPKHPHQTYEEIEFQRRSELAGVSGGSSQSNCTAVK